MEERSASGFATLSFSARPADVRKKGDPWPPPLTPCRDLKILGKEGGSPYSKLASQYRACRPSPHGLGEAQNRRGGELQESLLCATPGRAGGKTP